MANEPNNITVDVDPCIKPRDRDIEERWFRFAARIVKLAGNLPNTATGRLFANQVLRSGTSVGANVHEAQDSPTRKDFTWRINVARCEARETLY